MLKNRIKIIFIIVLLIISLLIPIVKADEETSEDEAVTISETQEEIIIKEGDEYLFQNSVTIDNPVDGNLFIIANTVSINSQIGGDAFICANTITIEEDGYILSNLFAFANTINVKGIAYNVYSIGNTLNIDGFVYRDVRSICNTLNINSMVGRNVFVDCSSINFKEASDTEETPSITSYGNIQGDLTYYSDKEISIPEDSVSGNTYFSSLESTNLDISTYMYSLGATLVAVVVLWLISLWISPKFLHNVPTSITWKKVLKIIGLGILVPLIIAILSIILLLIPITSQFIILLLCILVILFFISTSVTLININDFLCNKLKITQNLYKLGFLIITAFIFWLLTLIPYADMVIYILAIIWGIGSISYTIFIKEKKDEKISNSEEKIEEIESKTEEKDIPKESKNIKNENVSNNTNNSKNENESNNTTDSKKEKNSDNTNNSKKEKKSNKFKKNKNNKNKESDKKQDNNIDKTKDKNSK